MKLLDNKTLHDSIRLRLVEEIKLSGLSQTQIAQMVNISDASLSDYIHKGKLPSLETFALICNAIGTSADEILGLN